MKKWVKTADCSQYRVYKLVDKKAPSIWWYSFKGVKPYRVTFNGVENSFASLKEAKEFVLYIA